MTTRGQIAGGVDSINLAGSGGSNLVGFLQAGTGAVARTVQGKERDIVSVKDFGATGDGVTDDTAAFAAAILAAMTKNGTIYAASLYIPDGTYLITANNFLGNIDFSALSPGTGARYYFSMFGNGPSSIITWKPSGGVADYWMYEGNPGVNNLVIPTFKDLRFLLDGTNISVGATINGFKINGASGSAQQGFKFHRVYFTGADYPSTATQIAKAGTVIKILGTVNASETIMNSCRIRGMKTLLNISTNAESVNHSFISTDAEAMYGDVFQISAGSSVNVFGGSFSMLSAAASYFVAIRSNGLGLAGTHTFDSVRCEFNFTDPAAPATPYAKIFLLDCSADSGAAYPASFVAKVNFRSCNFYPNSGNSPIPIKVDAATAMTINFEGCDFSNTNKPTLTAFSSVAGIERSWAGPFTAVNFSNGGAVKSSDITFTDTSSVVRVSATNCIEVLDYDQTPSIPAGNTTGTNRRLKTASVFGLNWPDAGSAVPMICLLPANSLIRSVRFRKKAGGASVTGYQLKATDSNGVVSYCASTIAAQNVLHEATGNDLNIVCDTVAKQSVYIVCTAGNAGSAISTAMAAGDYIFIDYY